MLVWLLTERTSLFGFAILHSTFVTQDLVRAGQKDGLGWLLSALYAWVVEHAHALFVVRALHLELADVQLLVAVGVGTLLWGFLALSSKPGSAELVSLGLWGSCRSG